MDNYHMLQNYVQTPQQLFRNFCRSIGYDEHNCKSYEFVMDRTLTYRFQAKTWPPNQSAGKAWIGS